MTKIEQLLESSSIENLVIAAQIILSDPVKIKELFPYGRSDEYMSRVRWTDFRRSTMRIYKKGNIYLIDESSYKIIVMYDDQYEIFNEYYKQYQIIEL